jgi:tetrahydromethanopterin S-methyltransferase subunit G
MDGSNNCVFDVAKKSILDQMTKRSTSLPGRGQAARAARRRYGPSSRRSPRSSNEAEMTEDEVLDFLRKLDERFDAIKLRLDDIIVRLGHVETGLARVHVQLGEQAVHFDRIEWRLDRIEKRLDLTDI